MTYTITVKGIGEADIATAIARKIDNDGAAFAAFIDIEVDDDTQPVHASPLWTNRRTQECEHCHGFGTVGWNDDDTECNACLGEGVVDVR